MKYGVNTKPCPICGKDKKFKKCCKEIFEKQLKTETVIYFGLNEKYSGINYNGSTNQAEAILPDGTTKPFDYVATHREITKSDGCNKPHSVLRDIVTIDPIKYVLQSANVVFVIDTNNIATKENGKISVAAFFQVFSDAAENFIQTKGPGYIIFKDCPAGEEEKYSWMELIESVKSQPGYRDTITFNLISDHDLGNISEYNSQSKPIIGNYYLPKNFKIVYASDKPQVDILNKLIKECHREANIIKKSLVQDGTITFGDKTLIIENTKEAIIPS